MNPRQRVELNGSLSVCDAAGRTLQVHCDGARVKIDADSVRAAVSALRAAASDAALESRVLGQVSDFRVEICLRGRPVGRAGLGARANWLGRGLTRLPLELHASALLRAVWRAF